MTAIDPQRMTILLIDDDPFIRSTLREILVQIGVPPSNVHEADSPDSGLTATLRNRPNLVFCDVHMPAGDGFAYVAKLRHAAHGDVTTTPVVMLTADATKAAINTAMGLQVEGYLVKPASVATVRRAMDWALKPDISGHPANDDKQPDDSFVSALLIEGKSDDLLAIADLVAGLYPVTITKRV